MPRHPGGKGSGVSPDTSSPLIGSSSQTQGVTCQGCVGPRSPLPRDVQVQVGEWGPPKTLVSGHSLPVTVLQNLGLKK